MSFSDDHSSSPKMTNQESQDSCSVSFNETEKKSETISSKATNVLPLINRDEEVFKSRYASYWENPNYYESDDNMFKNTIDLLNSYDRKLGGNKGSHKDSPEPIKMNPTSGDFKNENDKSFLSLEDGGGSSDMEWLPQNPRSQMGEQRYGTNTCGIPLGPFGSIETMMKAKSDREEIKMVNTPRPRFFNRDQWPIKKILNPTDISSTACCLRLPGTFFEPYFQKHLLEADLLALVKLGVIVNVYDHDTETTHELCLALRSDYYVLMGDWQRAFIIRRCLREGQEIGLYWDTSDYMLHFTVLDYAYGKLLAEEKILKKKK